MPDQINEPAKPAKTKILFGGGSARDKAIFTRNLSIMLKSGLSLNESLEILSRSAKGGFKVAVENIAKSVAAGTSFSASLEKYRKYFSSFYIHTIRAGESSGNLDVNLEQLAVQMEKDQILKEKVQGAMYYPLIVLGLCIGVALTMSFVVLPKITPMFSSLKMDLPITTVFLIWFTDFMKVYGLIVVIAAAGVAALLVWAFRLKYFHPMTHYIILHIPIISRFSRNKNAAIFTQTMGALLKSGISIDEALQITADTLANYYYKKVILTVRKKVRQGVKLSECLEADKSYFSDMAIGIIKVGEKTGNLEEELLILSGLYEKEIDRAVKLLAATIEPAMLIIIGLVVGGLALSIITPIYSITGGIH